MSNSVRLWCASGEHWWERPSQRGRRPVNCPQHTSGLPIASVQESVRAERVPADGKEHRLVLSTEAERQELANLRAALPGMLAEYEAALVLACNARTREETNRRFTTADNLQDRLLSTKSRINKLEPIVV